MTTLQSATTASRLRKPDPDPISRCRESLTTVQPAVSTLLAELIELSVLLETFGERVHQDTNVRDVAGNVAFDLVYCDSAIGDVRDSLETLRNAILSPTDEDDD